MKTTIPVKAVADLMNPLSGGKYDALLPITITIEDGMLTLGTHDGPDLWRGKLKNLMEKEFVETADRIEELEAQNKRLNDLLDDISDRTRR